MHTYLHASKASPPSESASVYWCRSATWNPGYPNRQKKAVPMSAFEACRQITAAQVAQRAGMQLKKHGGKWWAPCPRHADKTPSLMFDEKGRCYCFSCGLSGGSADLYAAIYRVPPYEAAKALTAEYGLDASNYIPPQPRPEVELVRRVDEWKRGWWNWFCELKHTANEALAIRGLDWDDLLLAEALEARELAERGLDILQKASPEELLEMASEIGRIRDAGK